MSATTTRPLPALGHCHASVLWLLREIGPSTDEHLVAVYRSVRTLPSQSPSGIRTRRAELVAHGQVRDSGERGRLISGRSATIWEATPRDDTQPPLTGDASCA